MAVGWIGRTLKKIPSQILGGSKSFGEYAAKYGVGANRFKHFEDAKTFRNAKGNNKNIAVNVATEHESLIVDAFKGTKSKNQAVELMSKQLDDAGYVGGSRARKNLATLIVTDGMAFTRKTNIVRRFGTVAGGIGIIGIAALVCMNVGSWISNLVGGLLDPFLNFASDSDIGMAIVIGSVVIGSVYILNTTKEVLGS